MTAAPVAIAIPTRNRAEALTHSVRALLSQTFRDFTLFVVDSGSTDATRQAAASFNDPRLRYVRYEDDLGMAGNFNRALDLLLREKSGYIGIFHDDDDYAPEIIEREAAFLSRHPSAGFVFPAYRCLNTAQKSAVLRRPWPDDRLITPDEFLNDFLAETFTVPAPFVLARKDAYSKAGRFDGGLSMCLDTDMWLRMLRHYDAGYLCAPICTYLIHENQGSWLPRNMLQGPQELKRTLEKVLKDHGRFFNGDLAACTRKINRRSAGASLYCARLALAASDFDLARTLVAQATQTDPSIPIKIKSALFRLAANRPGASLLKTLISIKRKATDYR